MATRVNTKKYYNNGGATRLLAKLAKNPISVSTNSELDANVNFSSWWSFGEPEEYIEELSNSMAEAVADALEKRFDKLIDGKTVRGTPQKTAETALRSVLKREEKKLKTLAKQEAGTLETFFRAVKRAAAVNKQSIDPVPLKRVVENVNRSFKILDETSSGKNKGTFPSLKRQFKNGGSITTKGVVDALSKDTGDAAENDEVFVPNNLTSYIQRNLLKELKTLMGQNRPPRPPNEFLVFRTGKFARSVRLKTPYSKKSLESRNILRVNTKSIILTIKYTYLIHPYHVHETGRGNMPPRPPSKLIQKAISNIIKRAPITTNGRRLLIRTELY